MIVRSPSVTAGRLRATLGALLLGLAATTSAQGITFTPATLRIFEGNWGEYLVQLTAAPTADVTVSVTSDSSRVTIEDGASLTFTPSDWDIPQVVSVASTTDSPQDNHDFAITHTATSTDTGYSGLSQALTVAVEESFAIHLRVATEIGGIISADNLIIRIPEGTRPTKPTVHFAVGLTTRPNPFEKVTLSRAISDPDAAGLSNWYSALEFNTSQFDWDTVFARWPHPQDDADAADELVTFAITGSGGGYDDAEQTIVVIVEDDETAKVRARELGESDDATSLSVTEGETLSYRIRLDPVPSDTVTVSVTSSDSAAVTSDTTLTFTPSNFSTWQSVTINAAHDNDASNESLDVEYRLSGPPEYRGTFTTPVTVIDDDTNQIVVDPMTAGAAREDGGIVTYSVKLNLIPAADVDVTPTSNSGVATVSFADDDGDGKLNFTVAEYDAAQTVTVTLADDDVVNAPARTATISFSAATYATVTRTVTALDDDATVTLTETGGDTEVDEDGDEDTYAIVLDNAPTADVTISVTVADASVATASPGSLTFTTSDWSVAKTVTVKGADESVANASDRRTTISHGATGGGYGGASIPSVSVTAIDNDTAGVAVDEHGGDTEVAEDDGMDTYTIALMSEPTAPVTVSMTSRDTGAATVVPARVTFTTTDWDTPQTVTVTGVDDDVDNGANRQTTIDHSASGGDYNGITISFVTVTIVDDDVRGVTVTEPGGSTRVGENGGVDAYTVALASQPTADVTVTAASDDTAVATVTPASLTFTATDWDIAQRVTVTGIDDDMDNATDRQTTIDHSASGGDYQG